MNKGIIAVLPFIILLSLAAGLVIALYTYMHFPKMEPQKKMALSIKNAFYITTALLVLIYIFAFLFFQ
ncbi:MAG: hypothetical protein QW153_00275 [Candidatus Bilamarchaeaceae archaeon]